MTFRQLLCGLSGHSEVTRYDAQTVQRECFVCGKPLGAGWTTKGLAAPVRKVYKPRNFKEWTQQHEGRKRA